ncbi:hypothetical protein NLI96_g10809 [Meripilus lineatus]|uniref:Uncharacterized protein n=1 Tax=Meripilus lineatus TaxID=2056292 RepID=A0AAD5USW9_9APHY|nr:hypothetical protein NLI96_g10809 [Physisporinus lineatus]
MLPAVDLDLSTGTSPSGHPFTYAHILGVFHAEVLYNKVGQRPSMHIMEFLWVRRYQLDKGYKGGFKSRRLHQMSLVPETEESAFGFIDPDDVIRGVHLIPAFAHGHSFLPITDHDPDPVGEHTTPPINNDELLPQPPDPSTFNDEEEPEDSDSSGEESEGEIYGNMDTITEDAVDDFDPEDGEGDLLDIVNEEGFGNL